MALYHVAIGSIQYIVVIIEAVLRDAVISEVMVQVQVEHQLRGEHIVDQRHIVGLLHVQVRITISQGDGVGLVDVWIQVRDAWTRDAHVVGQAKVAACSEVVLQAG